MTVEPRSATRPPSVGVFLPNLRPPGDPVIDVVGAGRRAEELGFDEVWVVDQLIAGSGVPLLDSTVALAGVAAATRSVGLGYGVLVAPLRPTVWVAKQVASLQELSGGRVLLGVGVGGDRHDLAWDAAGVPRSERGRRLDAALAVLPGLIRGEPTGVGGATVTLAPGAAVPPILVGGAAAPALRRAVEAGGWFALPFPPADLAAGWAGLVSLAGTMGRPVPSLTASVQVALAGDPTVPDLDALRRRLTDPDGGFGMPAAAVDTMVVLAGPGALAERLVELAALGADRIALSVVAGDWERQVELVAEARSLTGWAEPPGTTAR